jgi:hypothetical protein
MTDTKITETARQIPEGVRDLNHLTMPGKDGLEFPADAAMVIGDLMSMAQRLPQLLGQLSVWLSREHDAGHVGHDSGQPAGFWVAETEHALTNAQEVAEELERHLRDAHNAASGLTGRGNTGELS